MSAGASLAMMTAIENALMLARTLILSRLLEPREFGLMGMAFIAINASEALSQTGFSRALVQSRGDPRPYLDTVWTVSIARGLLLAALVSLAAPLLGAFFRTPEAVPVLRVVSLCMVLRGLVSPAWHLLERDLDLRRLALPRTVGAGVDLIVTTALAFVLRSVWAMVFGYLSGTLVLAALTYVVGPYLPRPRFDRAQAGQLYAFGRHILRYEVLTYFIQQGDRVAVGRLRDVSSLGLYSFALRLATLPMRTLQTIVIRVVFPAFARIQAEPDRVRDAYLRLLGVMSVVSFPVAAGLAATAPELVRVLFGDRWVPMTMTFQILCLMAVLAALEQICGTVGGSIGRPELSARASLVRLALIGFLIVPATIGLGIEGAAAATTLAAAVSSAYLLGRVGRLVGVTLGDTVSALGVPLMACGAMLLCVSALRSWAPPMPDPLTLAMLVVAGAAAYVGSALALDRLRGSRTTASLLGILRSR